MAGYDGVGFNGSSGRNDDVLGPLPPNGPGGQPAAYQPHGDQRSNTLDRTTFGGRATRYGMNGEVFQSSGQDATQRYQGLGAAAAQRGAYQNNWAQANQSRAGQMDAARLMQSAAYGNQPSQAQILGQQMNEQALNNQMAAAGSARGGGLAQAAAMRQAQVNAAAQQQQANQAALAMRAQEMAQARGDYFGAQSGMRGQDIGQQGMNMQSELAQRQLNQQAQMGYEQLGWNTAAADQQAAMHQASIDSAEYMKQKDINQHSEDRETGVIGSAIGAVGSLAGMFSDMSAKTNVQPISGDITRQDPYRADADAAYLKTEQARYNALPQYHAGGGNKQAMQGLGSALGRFGGGMQMLSDERAKRLAFEEGAKYADAAHAGVQLKPPAYAVAKKGPEVGHEGGAEDVAARRAQIQAEAQRRAAQQAAAPAPQPQPAAQPSQQGLVSDAVGYGAKLLGPAAALGAAAGNLYTHPEAQQMLSDERTKTPLAKAALAMEGSAYEYKPEFTPPEQAPGERNVGPMAQKMAADPVAATAVKRDPESGMLMLDHPKMTKLNSAILADQQKQINSLAAALRKRGK